MSEDQAAAVAEATEVTEPRARPARSEPKRQPRYHVILWNDEEHSYDYVITMMRRLFGHSVERGMQIAKEVDNSGRAICLTTTREHAELKRDQIHAFGRDDLVAGCVGSMWSTIEPEPA